MFMLGAGPLMNEPMYGVGYVVEKIEMGRKIAGSAASEREIQELCGKELWSGGGGGGGGAGTGTGAGAGGGGGGGGGTGTGTGAGIGDGGEKGDKGGLLVGQLISDATEAFRLAFLSCPVSPCKHGQLPFCSLFIILLCVLYYTVLQLTSILRTVLCCTVS